MLGRCHGPVPVVVWDDDKKDDRVGQCWQKERDADVREQA